MSLEAVVGVLVFAVANFLFLLAVSFIIWMAVDAAKGDKYWWIVLVIGVPLIGATVYFFVEKKHEYSTLDTKEQP